MPDCVIHKAGVGVDGGRAWAIAALLTHTHGARAGGARKLKICLPWSRPYEDRELRANRVSTRSIPSCTFEDPCASGFWAFANSLTLWALTIDMRSFVMSDFDLFLNARRYDMIRGLCMVSRFVARYPW